MRNSFFILLAGILISVTSCRTDFDFETSANGSLRFSRDTVYLDTVFTNIGSSTYTLKVYNKSNKNVSIPTIQLGKRENSKYRMTVDGMRGVNDEGKIFNNVELLAKDSLYIFIETTAGIADANPTDFLYTDQIQLGNNVDFQKVELVTLIQDAYFIYPKRDENGVYDSVPIGLNEDSAIALIKGRNLEHDHPDNHDEFTFGNEKPYVIYGYASVPSGETLHIKPGARVHFHADSGLIIQEGGRLEIAGLASPTESIENEVVFEGDRLEPDYSDVAGQWGFIYLRQGSTADIDHFTLKNAIVGLLVENNSDVMNIKNTQIYDCSNVGILARAANINGSNIVINSAGVAGLACTLGGTYNFTHCTFNNNWPSSKQVAVTVDNYYLDENNQPVSNNLAAANFNNCIIFGSNQIEMLLNKTTAAGFDFNYKFDHCLIKFNNVNNPYTNHPEYQFLNDPLHYIDNIIAKNGNVKADFLDAENNKLIIGADSDAKGNANPIFSTGTSDILGNPRTDPSDIGAYNFTVFEVN
jgi:hypothetical protein